MKKVATIFIVLTLLVSFGWAGSADQAIKRVQLSRELSKLTRTTQIQVNTDAQKSVPSSDRVKILRNQMSKTHRYKTSQKVQPRLQILKNVGGFQPNVESREKTAPQSAEISMPMDTLALEPFLPDTIEYIAGDTFVFQMFITDTVVLEFYVDNGDSVFGEGDLLIDMMDLGDSKEIEVWDGNDVDETPAGDGIFQVTVNTLDVSSEGPDVFFGLQNCILYVYGWSTQTAEEFTGAAYIGAPDENTSIEGTVLVAEDLPYPAANVIVWAVQNIWDDDMEPKEEGEWGPMTGFLTMTDQNGNYRIEIPDIYRDDYIVGCTDFWQFYHGYFPDPPETEIYIGGDISPVDFTLIQGTETIYGIVTDETGVGMDGIRILAWGPYGESEVVTNSDGTYEIPAMPGWWEVRIDESDIYGQYLIPWSQELEVFEGGDHPVNFTLYGFDASFTGNVSTGDGMPLQDVEVHTDIWLGEDGGYFNWTYTDEYGNYELFVSTALQNIEIVTDWNDTIYSSYWVGAWMEDALLMPDAYFNQTAPASGLDFTAIIADASLSGTVFDAETSDPLWDAQVHAFMIPSGEKDEEPMTPEFWTNTDEFGNYEIPLVGGPYPGESWIIEVYWPWEWMPSVVDSLLVLSGNNYTKDYYISPPVTEGMIEGYVFDEDGNGIPGARVEIYGLDSYYEVFTDGDGYFYLDGIPFDHYSATAYAEGYDPYDIHDFWVGPEPTYLEFWMGSIVGDIMVDGYVVDETNTPVEGALMMLFNWNFNEPFILMTDDEGYFELMVKPGWYDFQVGANGFAAYNESLDIYSDTTLTFMLNSIVLPDTLEGNVVDDMGNPLRKVFIYMEKSTFINDSLRFIDYIGYTFTDINGHYKIALPTGGIDAMYSKEGFNPEWRSFDFPSEMPEDPVMLYPAMHVFGPELTSVADVPEDHGKRVRLTWRRAEGLEGSVKEYQIWRAIQPLNGPEPGPESYFDWDYVTTVPVHPDMEFYNVVVPTLYDAVGDDIYWTGFVVTAIGWDNWNYWDSNILAGFSVDNLPPEIPTGLAAVGDGENISLGWEPVTNEKVKYYSIYRKTAATDYEIIGYSTTADYVDDTVVPTETYIYSVTATDFGLNESDKSAPVSSTALAIDDQEEVPTEFALKPNYPNPFNPETTIEFALPKTSKVTLTIYNLTGQLVQELVQNEYSAGYHRVIWNGRDARGNAVGSGVYIYTLKADNFSQTRKMILMR